LRAIIGSILLALSLSFVTNACALSRPAVGDEAALKRYLDAAAKAEPPSDLAEGGYDVGWADLNGDGKLDAVVRDTGAAACGSGGCSLTILERTRTGFRLRGAATITRPPIKVLRTSHGGWRDLSTWHEGGGLRPGCTATIEFNGRRYRTQECRTARDLGGQVIIAGRPNP
jgi:hypothetical protein